MDVMTVVNLIALVLVLVLVAAIAVKVWGRAEAPWVAQLRQDLADTQARLATSEAALRKAENERSQLAGAKEPLEAALAEKTSAIARLENHLREVSEKLQKADTELKRAEDSLIRAAADLEEARGERDAAVAERKSAVDARDNTARDNDRKDIQIKSLEQHRDALLTELTQVRDELVVARRAENEARLAQKGAESEARTIGAKLQEIQSFVEGAKEKLTLSFMELAKQTFAERSEAMDVSLKETTARTKADIDALLKPMQVRLEEFKRRVDEVHTEETRSISSLLGQVTKLEELNQRMANSTDSLTKALKSSAKVRGDWGELALDSVLEASGLIEGQHFEKQVAVTTTEGGQRRPDVVVKLPGDRRIVVDAKAVLLNWQAAVNAEDPEEQRSMLKAHAAALRGHVDELSKKAYPTLIGGDALEFTIAFIPVEGALSGAIAVDPGLQVDAFAKRVALATPNTLMAMLSLCGRIWQREQVQREAEEISKVGGLLLQSVENFMDSFEKAGRALDTAVGAHREAKNQLTESTHSVASRAKKLESLGLKLNRPARAPRKAKAALPPSQDAGAPALASANDDTQDTYSEPTVSEILGEVDGDGEGVEP